jgi:hypothetical protein
VSDDWHIACVQRHGERVRYVVVYVDSPPPAHFLSCALSHAHLYVCTHAHSYGAPNAPLMDLVVAPHELLSASSTGTGVCACVRVQQSP